MVGHHNVFVQFDKRKMFRGHHPMFLYNYAKIIQHHFSINDLAEDVLSFVRADRYEVRPA